MTQESIAVYSPINDERLGEVPVSTAAQVDAAIRTAHEAFLRWRCVPAPKRGELVRDFGERLRTEKARLGELVSKETGKIRAEGEGEIQEIIDICEFAVGLSRQLCGSTMHSERPDHRMYEQWHPLGVIGVITAFNFPAAVWGWNAMIALVCGDTVVWKPSEITPLIAVELQKIIVEISSKHGHPDLCQLVVGGREVGEQIAADRRIPLVSATGSTSMGRAVAQTVAQRLGRSLLELGGNNAAIITADADLKLVVPATLFGAVGTAGQRCTTIRRILVERSALDNVTQKLVSAYGKIKIGSPLESGVLMGPLINQRAVDGYLNAIETAKAQGGRVLYGGKVVEGLPSKKYVMPTLIAADRKMEITHHETFAPIAYIIPFDNVNEAIEINNEVPQGLSSAIFTGSLKAAETFLSARGSDCGIANVNIGTSGAEIGGAFGGEKDTGGGRESGSDAWRQYMRRQTNTINWSDSLPLAQGIKFDV